MIDAYLLCFLDDFVARKTGHDEQIAYLAREYPLLFLRWRNELASYGRRYARASGVSLSDVKDVVRIIESELYQTQA